MGIGDLLAFLIIGLLAGFIAGKLMRGGGFGLVGNLIIGVIRSLVGGLIFRIVGLAATGFTGSLIMATLGAVVLLWLLGYVRKR
jgi:uncharacterized membrane protein YeaQ/YmgE (transglycosylase-associated protein family)